MNDKCAQELKPVGTFFLRTNNKSHICSYSLTMRWFTHSKRSFISNLYLFYVPLHQVKQTSEFSHRKIISTPFFSAFLLLSPARGCANTSQLVLLLFNVKPGCHCLQATCQPEVEQASLLSHRFALVSNQTLFILLYLVFSFALVNCTETLTDCVII